MSKAVIKLVGTVAKDLDGIVAQIKQIANTINVKSRGPIFLPTRVISQTTRKTPCGDGSHTYERWEMRVHKRLIEIDGSEPALRQMMRIRVPDTVQIQISLVG